MRRLTSYALEGDFQLLAQRAKAPQLPELRAQTLHHEIARDLRAQQLRLQNLEQAKNLFYVS